MNLKERLMRLIAMSGEIGENIPDSLCDSKKYLANVILEMKNDRLITAFKRDELSGYRLTTAGRKYLLSVNTERYAKYFIRDSSTGNVRTDVPRRLRCHRLSEVLAFMDSVGIVVDRDIKPPLYEPLAVESQPSQSSQSSYYTSLEFKDIGDEAIKANTSRSLGIILNDNSLRFVYNTGDYMFKWERITEAKMKLVICSKLSKLYGEYCSTDNAEAIMFGQNMDVGLMLLNSNGGYNKALYQIDHTYNHFYFIPNDDYGRTQFKLMYKRDLYDNIKSKLLIGVDMPDNAYSLCCDGYADEKTAVLFACDFDLQRLSDFKIGIETRGMTGIVFCFDYQSSVLAEYFGSTASLRVIDSKKLADKFGI